MRGSFLEISEQDRYECRIGSILIKPPCAIHSNRYGRAGARCFIVEVAQEFLDAMFLPAGLFDRIRHLSGGVFSVLGARAYREFQRMDDASALAIEGFILSVLSEAVRAHRAGPRGSAPPWLGRAKEILEDGYRQRLRLSAIAQGVGVHPAHLARAFRRYHHCTMGEYLRRLRLDYAIRKMSATDRPLSEIALDAGFYDQSHFTHAFKQRHGVTPSQYLWTVKPKTS
jgi:AraC family transcriptional regulator